MQEHWVGAVGPNFYIIFSADLFSVLADQQLPVQKSAPYRVYKITSLEKKQALTMIL